MKSRFKAIGVLVMGAWALALSPIDDQAGQPGCDVWHCLGGSITCQDQKDLDGFCESVCQNHFKAICSECSDKRTAVFCVSQPPE
jgi:hypothetical protein